MAKAAAKTPATFYDREQIAANLRKMNRGKLALSKSEIEKSYKSVKGVPPEDFLDDVSNLIEVDGQNVYDLTARYTHVMPVGNHIERDDVLSNAGHLGNLVPDVIPNYVPFGCHDILKRIIRSGKCSPVFITGLSGCGKTTTVEAVCHELGRELFRVNITAETDEDDLIGGYRLANGKTVFQLGPVIEAMRRGGILLLDEVDLGTSKILCLQSVFDSRRKFISKINMLVKAAPGFQIIATANTKGQGSESGKFVGTNIMNEAQLDRYNTTIEQEYPPQDVEARILQNVLASSDIVDDDLVKVLVSWAQQVRAAHNTGACSEVISTRRLVQIVSTYAMIADFPRALKLCLSRFDSDTANTMAKLFEAIDPKTLGSINIPKGVYAEDSFEIPEGTMPWEK